MIFSQQRGPLFIVLVVMVMVVVVVVEVVLVEVVLVVVVAKIAILSCLMPDAGAMSSVFS